MSNDDGKTFLYPTNGISGDIGYPIVPGTGKQVQWTFDPMLVDLSAASQSRFRLKIVADDLQPVSIPEAVSQVSPENLAADLLTIEGVRNVVVNSAHHAAVRNLLRTRFSGLGLQAREATQLNAG